MAHLNITESTVLLKKEIQRERQKADDSDHSVTHQRSPAQQQLNQKKHKPGGAAIVGAKGAGTPRPAARPIPVPGAALAPSSLDFD